jgi:hypothetical protein
VTRPRLKWSFCKYIGDNGTNTTVLPQREEEKLFGWHGYHIKFFNRLQRIYVRSSGSELSQVVVVLGLSHSIPYRSSLFFRAIIRDLLLTAKSVGNQTDLCKSAYTYIQTVQTGGYKMARQSARAVSLRCLSAVFQFAMPTIRMARTAHTHLLSLTSTHHSFAVSILEPSVCKTPFLSIGPPRHSSPTMSRWRRSQPPVQNA